MHKPLKTSFLEVDEALGGGLACPSVLEIVGTSGSGKTEFLLNMCAENILPTEFEGVSVGGGLTLCVWNGQLLPCAIH